MRLIPLILFTVAFAFAITFAVWLSGCSSTAQAKLATACDAGQPSACIRLQAALADQREATAETAQWFGSRRSQTIFVAPVDGSL